MTEDSAPPDRCWCCGDERPERYLLRLGEHPEVGVCLDCVHHLRRRAVARDEFRWSPLRLVRAATAAARDQVVARGWHERGRLGEVLRVIDRRVP